MRDLVLALKRVWTAAHFLAGVAVLTEWGSGLTNDVWALLAKIENWNWTMWRFLVNSNWKCVGEQVLGQLRQK
jgi:hypothetical protein